MASYQQLRECLNEDENSLVIKILRKLEAEDAQRVRDSTVIIRLMMTEKYRFTDIQIANMLQLPIDFVSDIRRVLWFRLRPRPWSYAKIYERVNLSPCVVGSIREQLASLNL